MAQAPPEQRQERVPRAFQLRAVLVWLVRVQQSRPFPSPSLPPLYPLSFQLWLLQVGPLVVVLSPVRDPVGLACFSQEPALEFLPASPLESVPALAPCPVRRQPLRRAAVVAR